jgi:Uma2 family endonuclease
MAAIAPEIRRMKLSRVRYDAMIEAGILTENDAAELLDGQLYEGMPKGALHSATVNRLAKALASRTLNHAILSVQNPLALHEYSEPEPDVAVLKFRPDFYEHALPAPSDVLFLIEVSDSTLAYDRDLKIPLYAAADVPEVWLVDVQARTVTVYSLPRGNSFGRQTVYRSGESLPIPGFPGETLPLSEVGF